MYINSKNFQIELTESELRTIAYGLKYNLEHLITTHYVKNQSSWPQAQSETLELLGVMFKHLLRDDAYEGIYDFAKNAFTEHNKAKETTKP